MKYTWRKLFLSFFLCLVLIFVLHFNIQQKFLISQKQQQYDKSLFCSIQQSGFYYDKKLQILYSKVENFHASYLVKVNFLDKKQYFAEDKLAKYLVYFIDTNEEETLIQIQNEYCLTFITPFSKVEHLGSTFYPVFFDEHFYFIRRDQSYICNQELKQLYPFGKCNDASFYIDLSAIL